MATAQLTPHCCTNIQLTLHNCATDAALLRNGCHTTQPAAEVQKRATPVVLDGDDCIIQSETGSGGFNVGG